MHDWQKLEDRYPTEKKVVLIGYKKPDRFYTGYWRNVDSYLSREPTIIWYVNRPTGLQAYLEPDYWTDILPLPGEK